MNTENIAELIAELENTELLKDQASIKLTHALGRLPDWMVHHDRFEFVDEPNGCGVRLNWMKVYDKNGVWKKTVFDSKLYTRHNCTEVCNTKEQCDAIWDIKSGFDSELLISAIVQTLQNSIDDAMSDYKSFESAASYLENLPNKST